MFLKFCFTSPLLFLLCIASVPAQTKWNLHSDKNGIQVYTLNLPNSPFKALKAVCTIETTLTRLTAVLLDVKNTKDWVYATKVCSLLKQVSPSELYYYSELSLPWPASNRDFIIRITATQDPKTKILRVVAENKPDYVPTKKNIIRIRESGANWTITPLPKGLLKIEYVMQVDPGGMLPAWLVNMFVTRGPSQTFIALREQVKKPIYDNVHLGFIKD